MIVVAAAGIEGRSAGRTLTPTFEVLIDRQFYLAVPAKHCLTVPFAAWPDFHWVARQSRMAVFTGVIDPATLHLDSYDVARCMVMSAARLRIQIDSTHVGKRLQTSGPLFTAMLC
jgi:hypothetical protein